MNTANQKPPFASLTHSTGVEFAHLSDRDLLDGWRCDRSRLAFDELVRRYRVMVLSVCRRYCQTEQDADDAFQTTWVCFYRTDTAWDFDRSMGGAVR